MNYMGGKAKKRRDIAEVIMRFHQPGMTYLEPFLGGGSILEEVAPRWDGTVVASDAHPDLMIMWQCAQIGWEPPAYLSKDEWESHRNQPPSAMRAFAGFGCSFGGKFFHGYASNNSGTNYADRARRGIVRKSIAFGTAELLSGSYDMHTPGDGWLVYCDPPYAKTTGYGERFDHDEFWRVMTEWASNGAVVLVSEYGNAPNTAVCVCGRRHMSRLLSVEKTPCLSLKRSIYFTSCCCE